MSEFWLDKALSKQTWTSVASSALALTRSGRLVVLTEPAPAIAAWAEPTANSGTARATNATAARVSHALLSRDDFNGSSLGLGFRCPGPCPTRARRRPDAPVVCRRKAYHSYRRKGKNFFGWGRPSNRRDQAPITRTRPPRTKTAAAVRRDGRFENRSVPARRRAGT